MKRKPFFVAQAELIAAYWPRLNLKQHGWLRTLLSTPGNILFTLLIVGLLIWAQTAGALSGLANPNSAIQNSQSTIPYQGRLADADGNPLTDTVNMIFRLYGRTSGGAPLWEEQWTGSNGVQVSDGLFNDYLLRDATVGTDDETTRLEWGEHL